ncbi:MAG TPA: recombination-associated protein RdgC [Pseudidiomarina sp.]|nr:recombination-associated protein RdgC [Pseudidiomarina sp.]
MWFRNLRIYTLADDFVLPEALDKALEPEQFKPCGRQELASFGWSSPFGGTSEQWFHSIGKQYLFCARKEERVLPAAVINGELEQQLQVIEVEQDRKVGAKEKQSLKEDIIHRLMPQAFTKFSTTWGMINMQHRVVIVDASTASKAENFLALLRGSLGSLPVKPWLSTEAAETFFTQWLRDSTIPGDFAFGDELELRDTVDEGGVVRARQIDLTSTEIKNHLEHGKQVTKLGLIWADRLSFVMEADCSIKRLKPTDRLTDEQEKISTISSAEKIDSDFALLSGELHELFPALVSLFQTQDGLE